MYVKRYAVGEVMPKQLGNQDSKFLADKLLLSHSANFTALTFEFVGLT